MVRHGDEQLNMAANNRLKAARVLKGMTQLQLADEVCLKEIEVSRIETGRVDAELNRRIADVPQKPTFELFMA
jgi:transcriptional regulator with XRE-family HTH domain